MAQTALEHPVGQWTFDGLRALPESAWRFEIVDGGLVMTPPPGRRHEVVSAGLRTELQRQLAPGHVVLGPLGVDLAPSMRIPDLVVVSADTARSDAELTAVDELELVIEIVSPGSRLTDRVTKPAQYAAAGVGAYWRVETEDTVSLTAYILGEGAATYTELGTWGEGETARIEEPFDLEIAIDALVP